MSLLYLCRALIQNSGLVRTILRWFRADIVSFHVLQKFRAVYDFIPGSLLHPSRELVHKTVKLTSVHIPVFGVT